MTGRMRQFQHVVAHELPVLYDDFDLPAEARRILEGYVGELQDWMAGILTWHQDCHRYKEPDLRRHNAPRFGPLAGPTELGTSAARSPAAVPRAASSWRKPITACPPPPTFDRHPAARPLGRQLRHALTASRTQDTRRSGDRAFGHQRPARLAAHRGPSRNVSQLWRSERESVSLFDQ